MPTTVTMQATRAFKEEFERERAGDADLERPGLGGRIARAITGGVEKLLEQTISYDLDDIESATYDGQKIVFEYRDKHRLSFEEVRVKNEPALASFSDEDSRRFVEAFERQKGGSSTPG